MGKNSKFERAPRDYYKTPESAVLPLLRHIKKGMRFAEPCAGDGQLVRILQNYGLVCLHASDIEPQVPGGLKMDALELVNLFPMCEMIITNPPWEKRVWMGEIFNKLLRHWLATFIGDKRQHNHGDIWLLFDADWMHTMQAIEFMPYCKRIVSVGRVKWFPGTDHDSKENCAWYCFNANHDGTPPAFYGRQAA